jgi:Tol biopolymer transport system component
MKLRIVLLLLLLAFSTLTSAQDIPFIPGNSGSFKPSLSADGRMVAFTSDASNLVADDSNGTTDVFVHDREAFRTTRVSVASDGTQGDDYSTNARISDNGRFVVFESRASNLVADDTNGDTDIFVHDLTTGETTRVSVAADGRGEANGPSFNPDISADGNRVTFTANASNLVDGETISGGQIYVYDRERGKNFRVSVASNGVPGNGISRNPVISNDGTRVVFWSQSTNLVKDDTNDLEDLFMHDLITGETIRVNTALDGSQADGYTFDTQSISGDGTRVAFWSQAGNLVPGDDDESRNDIFVKDLTTGDITRLPDPATPRTEYWSSPSFPWLSGDGMVMVFTSNVDTYVPDDTNETWDVFVYDFAGEAFARASVSSSGVEGRSISSDATISDDGRVVAFESLSDNLVVPDWNFNSDIFVLDRDTGEVSIVSIRAVQ